MLRVLFPGHFDVRRPSYTCYHLCRSMATVSFPVNITVPSYARVQEASLMHPALPYSCGRILGKLNKPFLAKLTEKAYTRTLGDGDICYIWGNVSTALLQELKSRRTIVFREKINGLKAAAKEILDDVYGRLGRKPAHGLTAASVSTEVDQLDLVDYIFVANPIAADQYARFGVDAGKLIRSSYGWEHERFSRLPAKQPDTPLTVLFVGVADVRKGVNLLLEAWARSGIDGRLLLAGPVADEIQQTCADLLARPDVVVTGWRDDIEESYASADIFAFPSHEEGGPVVTYEAMGCGLPVIVSPIGAGAIARHELDGFVVDPFDLDGWVDALRRLAADPELRRHMGCAARERAQDFTWQKVGTRRRQAIEERAGSSAHACCQAYAASLGEKSQ